MQLPEVKPSHSTVPIFTSEPKLAHLALILTTLLILSHTDEADIQRVFELVQVAYECGILTGMERAVSKLEAAALKKLDNQPPAEVS